MHGFGPLKALRGVCLLAGELRDVEDLAGKRPLVRCPRHNKTFDLQTGHADAILEPWMSPLF